MPFQYESLDLFFSNEGDYKIDVDGDILDTYFDPLLGVGQTIRDRVKYEQGAWGLYPNLGVDRHPFGMYNFEENADLYQGIIESALMFDGVILPGDLEVNIAPFDFDSWIASVALDLEPSPTVEGASQRVFFLSFNNRNNKIQYF